MSRVKRNILVTDINNLTDKISDMLMTWDAMFTQLTPSNSRINLNFTQLETHAVMNAITNEPTHFLLRGLKNFTILIFHKNKALGERFQNFQPIYILNDKESYEACFDQSSELNFVFLHKKKRKFQVFEQLNIKDISAYYEETIDNIIESVNTSLQQAMINPKQDWSEEQQNLEKNIIEQFQLLKEKAKKNIKKNEMKRRVSRLAVINLIYDHPKQNLYLKRLSDLAKMSPRSLQTNFLNSYDISPTHFHKFVRLTAVNHQLKVDEPRTNQVTRIAISHGFTHLGQFSCDYKKYFKESPSDTLYSDAV